MSARRAWAPAREVLLMELAVYRALARWIVRRPDVPECARAIGYGQLVGPMLWLWIFGSATEVVVIEVVLRQVDAGWAEAIRLPLLILGGWGLVWMIGLMAAYRVRPHLVTDEQVLVRSGLRTWAEVPFDAVHVVRSAEHELPSTVRTLHHGDGLLLVGVNGRTSVELTLAAPTRLATSKGELLAERVGLWVDDPRAVARVLAGQVTPR